MRHFYSFKNNPFVSCKETVVLKMSSPANMLNIKAVLGDMTHHNQFYFLIIQYR